MTGYIPVSKKTDWRTPAFIFDQLNEEFDFTIDAAASVENTLCERFWSIEDDALKQSWTGERVFCNPPYGPEQTGFIRKAAQLEADVSVLLLPARVDTRYWHDHVFGIAEIRFVRGRIKFAGAKSNAPFPSAVVIYRRPEQCCAGQ